MKMSLNAFIVFFAFNAFSQVNRLKVGSHDPLEKRSEGTNQIDVIAQGAELRKVYEWKNVISYLENSRASYINKVIEANQNKMISQSYVEQTYVMPYLNVSVVGYENGDELFAVYYNQDNKVIGKAAFTHLVSSQAIKAADGWRGRGRMGEERVTDRIEVYYKSPKNKNIKLSSTVSAKVQMPTLLNAKSVQVDMKKYQQHALVEVPQNLLTVDSFGDEREEKTVEKEIVVEEMPETKEVIAADAQVITGNIYDGLTGKLIQDVDIDFMGTKRRVKNGKYKMAVDFSQSMTLSLGASKSDGGYLPVELKILKAELNGGKIVKDIVLLPKNYGANKVVIVLTWGLIPHDLDSHLFFGKKEDLNSKIYFEQKKYQQHYLDLDDIQSYGPETTTIPLKDGKAKFDNYVFRVTQYNGGKNIATSGAEVKVYIDEVLTHVFRPAQVEGVTWDVFKMNEFTEVTEINTLNNHSWHESHSEKMRLKYSLDSKK